MIHVLVSLSLWGRPVAQYNAMPYRVKLTELNTISVCSDCSTCICDKRDVKNFFYQNHTIRIYYECRIYRKKVLILSEKYI